MRKGRETREMSKKGGGNDERDFERLRRSERSKTKKMKE